MIRRTLIAPLVALILATACPLSSAVASADSGGDLARIVGTGQALTKAGSAKFTGTVEIGRGASLPSSPSGTVSFTGAFDFKHRNGRFTIDSSALAPAGSSAKIRFLLVNGVAYISLDSLKGLTSGSLPPSLSGKKWLKLDLKTVGASANQLNQANPSSSLDTLRGVTSDIQNLGSDTVGGAATTHFRIHIDLAKAIQNAPAAQRAQIQKSIDALGGSGILPADIWIDRQGRPRRFSLTFTTKTATTTTSASESFEFSDFGGSVNIAAPPSNQVTDFTQLLGGSKA